MDEKWTRTTVTLYRIARKGGLIAITGERGTGKTQSATIIAAWLLDEWRAPAEDWHGWRPQPVRYAKAADLFAMMHAGRDDRGPRSAHRLYSTCGFLVVDEYQERVDSDAEDRILTNIIDHRYDRKLPTLIISNMTVPELQAQLGPSVTSRIQETGRVQVFTWPSFRARTR